jgi:hypothetical protein
VVEGCKLPVVELFEMAPPTKRLSFPRKWESTPQAFGNALLKDWIPAFAGMTATCSAHVKQMTPLPSCFAIVS